MAGVKLNHIYKVYPNGVKAVNDFCMDIEDKEFIVFVGPSGCGKSTTLRMIAGLEEISAGEMRIGNKIVNNTEPKDRDIAMVFQNYALYPHMTVYENMTFGLKMRKIPDVKRDKQGNPVLDEKGNQIPTMRHYSKEELDAKVKEAAEILGITEYLDRKPKAMSGGQRQRVALGRAIVREPKVFLLDEPLSNLDAKLRTQMRSEIAKLHRKLQTTFIYVTHDQVEAMTMGTRIVVMKDGFVQQIDTPKNLYKYPCNIFVAGFIGTPQMNFFKGNLKLNDKQVKVTLNNTDFALDVPYENFYKVKKQYLTGEKTVVIGLRAENVSCDKNTYPYKAKCRITNIEELGTETQIFADLNLDNDIVLGGDNSTRIVFKAPTDCSYSLGDVVDISLDLTRIHLFDEESGMTIAPRLPEQFYTQGSVKGGKLTLFKKIVKLPSSINLKDGKYDIVIPPNAVSFDGDISAVVVNKDLVNKTEVLTLSSGDKVLFALNDNKNSPQIGAEVKVGFDLKSLSFINLDDGTQTSALNTNNSLIGKLVKTKEMVEKENNGRIKKVTETVFKLVIGDYAFDCPLNVAALLINGGGKDIYKKELDFRFSPYQVTYCDTGITATVENVVDYGTEKFAKCHVGETVVYVSVDKDFELSEVKLSIDLEGIAIVEKERDIRLV